MGMGMLRTIGTMALALVLAGCGPGYSEEFKNSSSVTYWYDPARQSMGAIQGRAQAHCEQNGGKDALISTQSGNAYTGITASFFCRKRD